MFNAAREKSRLWLLILVGVVAALLSQTHAQQIFEQLPPASGKIALTIPATTGYFYDADRYDATDCLLAAKGGREADVSKLAKFECAANPRPAAFNPASLRLQSP